MAIIIFSVVVVILFIMAVIDYHNDPPSGLDGGML